MTSSLSRSQRLALAVLRTAIGWHFAYEGLYKMMTPGWSRSGQPLRAWTAAGFLNSTSGPLAPLFQRLGQPPALAWVDVIVPLSLLLIGVSMMLGVFTRISYWAAVLFLALVYLASIPTSGLPAPAAEGTYLLVNKNLIEALAVLVLIAFETRRGAPVATRTAAVASERVA